MSWKNKWKIIEEMPGGGQGKVYRVINKLEYLGHANTVISQLRNLTGPVQHNIEAKMDELFKHLPKFISMSDIKNHYALKELHDASLARDSNLASLRMEREINVMKVLSELNHPNIIKLIDHSDIDLWFVTKFYPMGSLRRNKEIYMGDGLSALKAILPLLSGLSELHKKNTIHRDIKPDNIFVDFNNQLVLGDFGLVYPGDDESPRQSESYDNVGSRDWEPAWAYGSRLDIVKPTFDLFSIGKMIWAMISGRQVLRLWYFDRPEFDLEKCFPDSSEMQIINQLLSKVIVEEESDCLSTVDDLITEINNTIKKLEDNWPDFDIKRKRLCPECHKDYFRLIADGKVRAVKAFGLNPVDSRKTFVFECPYCGLIQIFSQNKGLPIGWENTAPQYPQKDEDKPTSFSKESSKTS